MQVPSSPAPKAQPQIDPAYLMLAAAGMKADQPLNIKSPAQSRSERLREGDPEGPAAQKALRTKGKWEGPGYIGGGGPLSGKDIY